nr:MAG TPA: hypothetical protein [Caudoviricetes sp.]
MLLSFILHLLQLLLLLSFSFLLLLLHLLLTSLHILKLLLKYIEVIICKNLSCFKQACTVLHSWLNKLL